MANSMPVHLCSNHLSNSFRYDPVIRAHYEWSQSPSSWSMQRYMFIHDALTSYQAENKKIGENITRSRACTLCVFIDSEGFVHTLRVKNDFSIAHL